MLCWIGAIALLLLFFGADQMFVQHQPRAGAVETHKSLPQRQDLPAAHALARVNHPPRQ